MRCHSDNAESLKIGAKLIFAGYSKFDAEYSISEPTDPPTWFKRFPILLWFWYNPIVLVAYNNMPRKQILYINMGIPVILLMSIMFAVFSFVPAIMMLTVNTTLDSDLDDIYIPMASLGLLTMPVAIGLGLCLRVFGQGIFSVPRRIRARLDSQQPDPLLATTLTDSDIFFAECFSPFLRVIGLFASLLLMVLWIGIISLILTIGGFIEGFTTALNVYGGVAGFMLLITCIALTAILFAIYAVLTTGSYSSGMSLFPAACAATFDIILFSLISGYLSYCVVTRLFPGFRFTFFHRMESTFSPGILLFAVLLLIMMTLGTLYTAWNGVRIFGRARQGDM